MRSAAESPRGGACGERKYLSTATVPRTNVGSCGQVKVNRKANRRIPISGFRDSLSPSPFVFSKEFAGKICKVPILCYLARIALPERFGVGTY